MEYHKDKKGYHKPVMQKNIDTGMGVERTLAIINNLDDDYLTETFLPLIKEIEKISKTKYSQNKEGMRIIADHIKAAVFILADDIVPSNKEHGYILRRLIRRAVRYGKTLGMQNFTKQVAQLVFKIYPEYSHLQKNKSKILTELEKEEKKFGITLEKGLNKFKKFTQKQKRLSGKDSFLLFQSFGFPIEMLEEEAKKAKIKFSRKDFDKEFRQHQKLSQTASKGRFKSGLSDHSEKTTQLHTTTHLLLSALRKILKDPNIIQKGGNINAERLRLDFSFPRQVTKEELKKVETLVNNEIKKNQKVNREEMSPTKAKKAGALGSFDSKYGNKVSVYTIGTFSKEICAGPHVKNTKELGKFRIKKESSVGAGARRIKATLEEYTPINIKS